MEGGGRQTPVWSVVLSVLYHVSISPVCREKGTGRGHGFSDLVAPCRISPLGRTALGWNGATLLDITRAGE